MWTAGTALFGGNEDSAAHPTEHDLRRNTEAHRHRVGAKQSLGIGRLRLVTFPDGSKPVMLVPHAINALGGPGETGSGAELTAIELGGNPRVGLRREGLFDECHGVDRRSPTVESKIDLSGANVRRSKVLNCPDGRFTLDQLPAGHFQLQVQNEELSQWEEVDLREGQSATVQIRFKRVTVSGRLIDAFSRAPVPGIRVSTIPSAGTDSMSDSNGRFVIYGVTPGSIHIRSHSPPMDLWDTDDIEHIAVRVIGDSDTDLGDLTIIPNRLQPWEVAGKIGFEIDRERRITAIDPTGPAAKSGLVVGDIITTCDGVHLAGPTAVSWTLISRVRPRTPLMIGVERGAVAMIVTAP